MAFGNFVAKPQMSLCFVLALTCGRVSLLYTSTTATRVEEIAAVSDLLVSINPMLTCNLTTDSRDGGREEPVEVADGHIISLRLQELVDLCMEKLHLRVDHLLLTLPSDLGDFPALTVLEAQSVVPTFGSEFPFPFTGIIPTELGRLPQLTKLNLDSSKISGSMPTQLGNLHILKSISAWRNLLSGTVPSEFGKLQITYLDLTNNELTGSLPTELNKLQALTSLSLHHNHIQGSIPDYISATEFWLSCNHITGTIPVAIARLGAMGKQAMRPSVLRLCQNHLTGAIPISLWSFGEIELGANRLTGNIPSEMSKGSTRKLFLNQNFLKGSIPSQLGKATKLSSLFFRNNCLAGSLPSELSDIARLHDSIFSNNLLQGSLPSQLRKLSAIFFVDFAHNSLEGTIPVGFPSASIPHIALHNNRLTGRMPNVGRKWGAQSRLPGLRYLSLHENNFGGSIPPLFIQDRLTTLVLHGNFFSCALPEHKFRVDAGHVLSRSHVLLGNYIQVKHALPTWVPPSERDPILYFSADSHIYAIISLTCGILLFIVSVWYTLGMRECVLLLRGRAATTSLSASAQCRWSACMINRLASVSILAIFPACCLGSNFLECNIKPPCFASLGNARLAEWFVGASLFVYYVLVYAAMKEYERDFRPFRASGASTFVRSKGIGMVSSVIAGTGWALTVCLFALPTAAYALTMSLPKANLLNDAIGDRAFHIIHYVSPFVGSFLSSFVIQPVADKHASLFKLSDVELMLWFYIFCDWGVATIILVIMHESCVGAWRTMWSVCQVTHPDHKRLDIKIGINTVLSMQELCTVRLPSAPRVSPRQKCGRAIVRVMQGLLSQKLIPEIWAWPCLRLWLWYVSLPSNRASLACWAQVQRILESVSDGYLTQSEQRNLYFVWLLLSVTWGPLVPAVQALILLAASTNFITYQIGRRRRPDVLHCNESLANNASPPLLRLIVPGALMTFIISLQTSLRCTVLLCSTPCFILFDVIVSKPWKQEALPKENADEVEMTRLQIRWTHP